MCREINFQIFPPTNRPNEYKRESEMKTMRIDAEEAEIDQ